MLPSNKPALLVALAVASLSAAGCDRTESKADEANSRNARVDIPKTLLDGSCLELPEDRAGLVYDSTGADGSGQRLVAAREPHRMLLARVQQKISDAWFERDGKVQFQRWFGSERRRIDYEHGDLKALGTYRALDDSGRLVPKDLSRALGEEKPVQYRCLDAKARTARWRGGDAVVVRLVSGELAAVQHEVGGKRHQMRLDGFETKRQIEARWAQARDYQGTDFADVGDNESDPFLAQAIRQGFVVIPGHAQHDHDHDRQHAMSARQQQDHSESSH